MGEWVAVPGANGVQTYEYSFGPGLARTFAVLGPKGWVVFGPAYKGDEAMYVALEQRSKVAALVAPNAYHTMGLRAWHERYPHAQIFGPEHGIARVEKKGRVPNVKPYAAAKDVCGDAVEIIDLPHYKEGEALVRVPSPAGPIWHVTDVIFNWPSVPPSLVVKLLFTVITDSAPGFKLSGIAAFFQMKDKRGVYRFLKEEAQKAPPVRVVPSHGVDEVLDPPGERLLELLAKQGKV